MTEIMNEEEFKKMTVADVLATDLFRDKVGEVMDSEAEAQRRAMAQAKERGARISRSPIDGMRDMGVWDAETVARLYGACLSKTLVGFSSTLRAYIMLIGFEAYKRTINKMQASIGVNNS